MKKPRVAFFDFASCEGCQLQVINLEEDLLQVLEAVDVVSFREAMKEHSDDYDIAFVEGSITRRSDEARLKGIRKNAKVLVALGSCATLGGINCIKNFQDLDYVRKFVYGEKAMGALSIGRNSPWWLRPSCWVKSLTSQTILSVWNARWLETYAFSSWE
jgi:coenzyme F420-reducing hydrogenase gamma subunit